MKHPIAFAALLALATSAGLADGQSFLTQRRQTDSIRQKYAMQAASALPSDAFTKAWDGR